MQRKEEMSSIHTPQGSEMTLVDLIALFIKKRKAFFIIFAVFTAIFAGGNLLRAMISSQANSSDVTVTVKAIVMDPYFDRAGEFCSGLAITEAADSIVEQDLGVNTKVITTKNTEASYDSATRILSIKVRGKDEKEIKKIALADMIATRSLMQRYGSERYNTIADHIKAAVNKLDANANILVPKDAGIRYFEGYAQTVAARIELESLIETDQDNRINSSYPYSLLASDLDSAKSKESAAKIRFEDYIKNAGLSLNNETLQVNSRVAQILKTKIAVLEEILPTTLAVFDVVDLNVVKSAQNSVSKELIISIVAAFFLAVIYVLIIGYVDRIKANPEAMNIINEARKTKKE